MTDRLGRRGSVLAILGFIWIVIGISVPSTPLRPPVAFLFHEDIPIPCRVGGWIITGLIAMCLAPMRNPNGRDRWGFSALIVMPAERLASYAISWIVSLFSEKYGFAAGWINALVWLSVCTLILICAGWPEPQALLPPPIEPPETEHDDGRGC